MVGRFPGACLQETMGRLPRLPASASTLRLLVRCLYSALSEATHLCNTPVEKQKVGKGCFFLKLSERYGSRTFLRDLANAIPSLLENAAEYQDKKKTRFFSLRYMRITSFLSNCLKKKNLPYHHHFSIPPPSSRQATLPKATASGVGVWRTWPVASSSHSTWSTSAVARGRTNTCVLCCRPRWWPSSPPTRRHTVNRNWRLYAVGVGGGVCVSGQTLDIF